MATSPTMMSYSPPAATEDSESSSLVPDSCTLYRALLPAAALSAAQLLTWNMKPGNPGNNLGQRPKTRPQNRAVLKTL